MAECIGNVLARVFDQVAEGKLPEKDWSGNSDFIRRRTAEVLTQCSLDKEGLFHSFKSLCESPIECLALATLLVVLPEAIVVDSKAALKAKEMTWKVAIIPQMPFHGYRLDFAVIVRQTKAVFSLECDGRQFHLDKSKDNDRDVNLWGHGCIAFHVSGSTLCRDPIAALKPFAVKVRGGQYERSPLV